MAEKQTGNLYQIYLEIGKKKTFACAIEWPGWCRAGQGEEAAIQALLDYARRYAKILKPASLAFILPEGRGDFDIIGRVEGNASTDFGVPDTPFPGDQAPLSEGQINRYNRILEACWLEFKNVAEAAEGKELRKGPRGGGRELAEIVSHVAYAEPSYLKRLGWSGAIEDNHDIHQWMNTVHSELLKATWADSRGEYPKVGPQGGKRWPLAYFFRRVAWHVVDHTWEIEDRVI